MIKHLHFALIALLLFGTVSAQADNAKEMDRLARELVTALNKSRLIGKDARLAVIPFEASEVPIRLDVASAFNEMLMQSLTKRTRKRYRIVARSELRIIIADVEKTGSSSGDAMIERLLENAADIDVLISGSIRTVQDGVQISYTAVDIKGNVLAVTKQRLFELTTSQRSLSKSVMSLDAAIQQASEHFSNQVANMQVLMPKGIRFQSSGAQPDVGRYIEEKFVAKLANEYDSVLSNRRLRVERPRAQNVSQYRGISVNARAIERDPNRSTEGVYELEGSYWNFDDAIEIRLALIGPQGESIAWSERVQKASFPQGLAFEPPQDLQSIRDSDQRGAVDLYMSTSHGEDPVYRIGENVELVLQSNQDAWLYCFYRQANGETIQIIPNEYMQTERGAPTLTADMVAVIPDARIFPFQFEVTEPTGAEIVKCFAANRDITAQLPQSFRGQSLDPIDPSLVRQMSKKVRSASNADATEASVVITVVKD